LCLQATREENAVPQLVTTLGPRGQRDLGVILPHEHVFVDLRTPEVPGHGQAETAAVVAQMAPELQRAAAAGVTALVECTPVGVGRRADLLLAVSRETGVPLVVPTGVYREPWIPAWVHDASETDLQHWMIGELTGAIEGTGVQAGWIKLSAGDDGLTTAETKVLRAAAAAGRATGSVIGSHTIRGRVVRDQLAIVEAAGYTADRFIWIHTQAEPDPALHLEVARRGAWIEYDALGDPATPETLWLERILRVLDRGLGDRLLLSHDRGWFDPALPGGGVPQPFTYLCDEFIPAMRRAGIDAETIVQLTQTNPFRAFAR
jgi:phosphotriesterase-related protein